VSKRFKKKKKGQTLALPEITN